MKDDTNKIINEEELETVNGGVAIAGSGVDFDFGLSQITSSAGIDMTDAELALTPKDAIGTDEYIGQ